MGALTTTKATVSPTLNSNTTSRMRNVNNNKLLQTGLLFAYINPYLVQAVLLRFLVYSLAAQVSLVLDSTKEQKNLQSHRR